MKTVIYTKENAIEAFKKQIENVRFNDNGSVRASWGVSNGWKSFTKLAYNKEDAFDFEGEVIYLHRDEIRIKTYSGAIYVLRPDFFIYEGGARGFLEHDGVSFLSNIVDIKKTQKESKVISELWGCVSISDYCKLQIENWDDDNSWTSADSGFMTFFN